MKFRNGVFLPDRRSIAEPEINFRFLSEQSRNLLLIFRMAIQRWATRMRRATRTFKLKVSQRGFDLLVDCHVLLVRKTRTLLPYGTAVNVAVHHLATLEIERLVAAVSHFPRIELIGDRHARTIFVGAPHSMADVAKDIAARLREVMPDWQVPELAELYLLSLQQLIDAKSEDIVAAYDRTPRLQRGG